MKFSIITCSDTRSEAEDTAGTALKELIAEQGWEVASYNLVKDVVSDIEDAIVDAVDNVVSDIVLTCGGTGLSKVATGLLEIIDDVATEVVPKSLAHLAFPDVDNKPFVELAVYTNSIIITNNVNDFPFADLKVLRAGEFLKLFDR